VYGRPVVAGMTVPQVEVLVAQAVKAKEGKDHALTVRLVGRQSKVFYVLGEVNSPGSFPLSGRETVLDGLMAAGGLTRSAQEKKIILVRPSHPDGCREVLPVCYPQIVQLGDTHTNYQLRPGDRIYVPSQGMLEAIFPSHSKTTAPCCKPNMPCYQGGAGGCAAPAVVAPLGAPPAVPQTLPAGSFIGQ
jgi:protein involved in polysaccharide export with SLBB domain